MSDIRLEIDGADLVKVSKKLVHVKKGAETAVMRAINKSVSGMKTDAKKQISTGYYIKQSDIKDKIGLDKATINTLSGRIYSKGRPIRLVKYKIKANKSPGKKGAPTVYANVKKGSSGGYTGGFLANMKNGTRGVFVRTGKRKGKKETIRQLYSPGVVQMLDNKDARETIQKNGLSRFNKELDHQVEYLLSKS